MLVRLSTRELARQLEMIETHWKRILTDHGVAFAFLDATFDRQYLHEQQLKTISTCFSLLTLVVESLGLFGLSSLVTAQRTKEVDIRKVVGD